MNESLNSMVYCDSSVVGTTAKTKVAGNHGFVILKEVKKMIKIEKFKITLLAVKRKTVKPLCDLISLQRSSKTW